MRVEYKYSLPSFYFFTKENGWTDLLMGCEMIDNLGRLKDDDGIVIFLGF